MSSLLVLQQRDKLFFGSDTAMSTSIDDIDYRIEGYMKKIHQLKDGKLLFCSGKKKLVDTILSEVSKSNTLSIEIIRDIIKKHYKNYHHNSENTFPIDAMVGNMENGIAKLYQISPYTNFDILVKVVQEGEIGIWSAGIKTEESLRKAQSLITMKKSLVDIYKETFKYISYEKIGGRLELFRLDTNGIVNIHNSCIKANLKINKLPSYLYKNVDLVAAETLIGRILIGQELIMENEKGKFTFNQDGVSIKNTAFNLTSDTGGNGVTINSQDGIVITKSDDKVRTILNATDGIKVQVKKGNTWNNEFYYDVVNESLTVDGLINARDLKINGQSVLTNNGTRLNGLYVVNLNADNITAGTITGINITGTTITGATFNGGTINVTTNVNVGNTIYLNTSQQGSKGIIFNNLNGNISQLTTSSTGILTALSWGGIDIVGNTGNARGYGVLIKSLSGNVEITSDSGNVNINSSGGGVNLTPAPGSWAKIRGSNIVTEPYVTSALSNYYTKSQIDNLLAGKQDK